MGRAASFSAQRIAGIYTFLGASWIIVSDRLLAMLVRDPHTLTLIQTYKGWAFVLASGLLIFLLLNHELRARTTAQEALRESEAKYRSLFNNAEVGMFRTRLDGSEILDMNEKFLKIFGWTREEMRGNPSLVHWADPHEREEMVRRLNSDGRVTDFECKMQNRQGEVRVCVTSLRLYREQGILEGSIMDITERKRVQESLRESERRYRDLWEKAPVMMISLDVEARINFASDRFCEELGYEHDEVLGRRPFEFQTAESAHHAQSVVFPAFRRTGTVKDEPLQFVKKNGELIDVLLNVTAERDAQGAVVRSRSVLTDITERKRAEEALLDSEERFRTIAETITEVFWMADVRIGTMFYISPGYERVWGRPVTSLYENPKSFIDAIHEEDRERVIADLEAKKNLEPFDQEYRIVRPDGEIRWIWDRGFPVRDDMGQVTRYVGIAQDITERKKAQEALRESEHRFRSFVENAADIVYGLTPEGIFTYVSPNWLDLMGEPSAEAVGKSFDHYVHPDDVHLCRGFLERARRAGARLTSVDYRALHRDGSWRWHVSNGSPVRDEDGQVVGYVGIARDVTQQKQAEEALRESEARYRSLFENMIEGFAHCKMLFEKGQPRDFIFLEVNEAFEKQTGLKDVAGKRVSEVIPGIRESDPVMFEIYGRVAMTGQPKSFEMFVDALQMWFRILVYSPKREHFVAVFDVITERKRAEEDLRKAEERYRSVFENAAVGITVVDAEGRLVQVNGSFAQMLGYSEDELLNMTILDITHPEDLEDSQYRYQKMVCGETDAYRFEKRYIRKDGQVIRADVSASPVRGPDGIHEATIGVISDITLRKRAEEALFAAKRDWEDTFNCINDMITIHDKDYNIIHYNTAAKRLLGLPKLVTADVIKCYQYFHGKGCPPETCPSCQCLQTHQQAISEVFEPHLNMFVEITAIPRFGSDGQLTGLVHIVRDITERKISEEFIRIRLDLLEFAASHSLQELLQKELDEVGSLTNSPLGFYHFISEDERTISLQAWSTRTVKEFCQAEGRGRHYPVDQAGVWADAIRERSLMIHNDYSTLPHRKGMPEGHPAVIRELVVPIIRSGRIVAILGIGNKPTDYTEKDIETVSYLADVSWEIATLKRAQGALEESEQQYRTLFEESIDGVYSALRDGEITDANASFCKLFGYTREEMIGKDILELYFDPADRPKFQKEIEQKGFVKDYEVRFQKRDGTEVDCLLTSSVHFGKYGRIAGYRGIVRDLTLRKALQRQLQQAQKMEAVGTLAGGIAHDFNNILQVGLGYSELILGDEELPGHYKADIQKINESAKRGADLVQRLLTFSRKTEVKPLPLNLNRRINEVRKMLERTVPKMIEIQLVLGEDLAAINADGTQMDQILMNLAVNARDAMPEGGRLVFKTANVFLDDEYASSHFDANPGHYVLLIVTDTGAGMDQETLEHIFEPFYTTKEAGKGTGLGLAMVYGIVKQHGGHIMCYSEPTEGTTFKIYFPALVSHEELPKTEAEAPPLGGSETILLVDDEEPIRDLGARILSKSGYNVVTASNGKEALGVYERRGGEIALVVLDLIMPEMGGRQCLESLLSLDPSIKVVIASGYSADGPTNESLAARAKGFVSKPFDMGQLLQTVRAVLDEK